MKKLSNRVKVTNASTMTEKPDSHTNLSTSNTPLSSKVTEMSDASTMTEESWKSGLQSHLNTTSANSCTGALTDSSIPTVTTIQPGVRAEAEYNEKGNAMSHEKTCSVPITDNPNSTGRHRRAYSDGDKFSDHQDSSNAKDEHFQVFSKRDPGLRVMRTTHKSSQSMFPLSVSSLRSMQKTNSGDVIHHKCVWQEQVKSLQLKLRSLHRQV